MHGSGEAVEEIPAGAVPDVGLVRDHFDMSERPIILAVLREAARVAFEPAAALAGIALAPAATPEEARGWLATWPRPRAAAVDLDHLGAEEGLALVEELARVGVAVLVVGGGLEVRAEALARGARDFAARPFEIEDLALRLAHVSAGSVTRPARVDLRRLAAALAHEILNPLAGALGMTELALIEGVSPAARASLEAALEAGRRAAAIVHALEEYAGSSAAARKTVGAARPLPEALAKALEG